MKKEEKVEWVEGGRVASRDYRFDLRRSGGVEGGGQNQKNDLTSRVRKTRQQPPTHGVCVTVGLEGK